MRKPIPGFPDYEADSDGTIWYRGDMKVEPRRPGGGNYRMMTLHLNGRGYSVAVHAAVTYAFHGPKPSPIHQARHLNGNSLDNRADNLAWGTPQENSDDGVRNRDERGRRLNHSTGRHGQGAVRQRIAAARARFVADPTPEPVPAEGKA